MIEKRSVYKSLMTMHRLNRGQLPAVRLSRVFDDILRIFFQYFSIKSYVLGIHLIESTQSGYFNGYPKHDFMEKY